jgi:hypothetical protein
MVKNERRRPEDAPLGFCFSDQHTDALRRDLSPGAIAELARALSFSTLEDVRLEIPGAEARLRHLEAILEDGSFAPDVHRSLETPARLAREHVKLNRRSRRRSKRQPRGKGRPDRFVRSEVTSRTLRVLERQGMKTGGPRAARILAVALHARLGVPMGDEAGQLQVLQRERRRLGWTSTENGPSIADRK